MPNFYGIDVVPVACLAAFEQEIDTGASRAAFALGLPRLAVIAPLGMGG